MGVYKKMYLRTFNAITDAVEALEQQNYNRATDILRRAQIDSEEIYLCGGDSAEDITAMVEEQKRRFIYVLVDRLCDAFSVDKVYSEIYRLRGKLDNESQ